MRQQSPLVKNLIPGLTERGKIKIGMKGALKKSKNGNDFQLPVKLDHFIVTTLERGADGNFVQDVDVMKMLGKDPKRIPISLLYDSISPNFTSRYAYYDGKVLKCSGDGEYAVDNTGKEKKEVECPCHRSDPDYKGRDRCKLNGTLSVLIDGANSVGGIWKFRTTGFNSTQGLTSSLHLLRTLTGGVLVGLPLVMTVQPKVATDPDGRSQTIQVVGVEYNGNMQELRTQALQIARDTANFRAQIMNVEQEAQKLICVDAELIEQAGDITDEFYPEEPTIDDVQEEPKPKSKSGPVTEPEPEQDPEQDPEPEEILVLPQPPETDFDLFS